MNSCQLIKNLVTLMILAAARIAAAQTYDLSWHTIDGGGQTFSSGGSFSLGGTIGQPDAGVMSGGPFALEGGFWASAAPAGTGIPAATVTTAALRKTHALMGDQNIAVSLAGEVQNANVISEPRSGGITELRIAFDVAPGTPAGAPVLIEEQICATCPCTGTQAGYGPYTGASTSSATVAGNELIVSFTPGLENARTYRLTLSEEVTSIANQAIEVRGLKGDVNSDARVNATDRSFVVGVWTGGGFSAPTDIDLSGATNATDRSFVVAAWTGNERCAP